MKAERVPKAVIQRMAQYVQVLEEMKGADELISSDALARACDIGAAQVRKDLAFFGEFGVRGRGYLREELLDSIKKALGAAREWRVALVGVGNVGRALLRHKVLAERGFHLVAAFDCDQGRIGESISGVEVACVTAMAESLAETRFELGIIATPPEQAQIAADYLLRAKVKAIINFTSTRLRVPENVFVEYVDITHHFYAATFAVSTFKETGHWGFGRLAQELREEMELPVRPAERAVERRLGRQRE